MRSFTDEEAAAFELAVRGKDAEGILGWASGEFGDEMFMTSAFGPNSICLIDMLRRVKPDLRVVFIDTTYHFPETLELMRWYAGQGVNVDVLRPDLDEDTARRMREEQVYRTDTETCCRVMKVEVFARALRPGSCWVAPLRRGSAATRRNIRVVELMDGNVMRVCPLADWTRDDVWDYIRARGLRYNPLHDQGYASIGCAPCTQPVAEGEHERAGRWKGTGKVECGLHTFLLKQDADGAARATGQGEDGR